jgi:hypothetical protein
VRWFLTVPSAITRDKAISLLLMPVETIRNISNSRRDKFSNMLSASIFGARGVLVNSAITFAVMDGNK